jgi:hypothetical protein
MVSRSLRPQVSAVVFMLILGSGTAQIPSARAMLELSEVEQTKFVNETMEAGFPDERADQMTMLIINRSALVLPLIERRIEIELRSQSSSKDLIETAMEMIAYAGDEQAIREVSKLVAIDEARFGRFVARTLHNALNFRNPFTIAYRGVEIEDGRIAQKIGAWADSALLSQRMQRLWAEAMVKRYGRVPSEAEWAKDPLAVRLRTSRHEQLRENVTGFAREATATGNRTQ